MKKLLTAVLALFFVTATSTLVMADGTASATPTAKFTKGTGGKHVKGHPRTHKKAASSATPAAAK